MDSPDEDDLESSAWKHEVLARCNFVQSTFSASPMLISLDPNEAGFVGCVPYTGQGYNPKRWRLDPVGWNHDHCLLCMGHIVPGDTYWSNTGIDQVQLCEVCYKVHLQSRLA